MPRQLRISGTERPDIPQELEDAGEEFLEARSVQRSEGRKNRERTKEKEIAILTLLTSRGIPTFSVRDPETRENIDFSTKTSIVTRKSSEDDPDYADDETTIAGEPPNGVHQGLIDAAEQAQADVNVEEVDGDVMVPEKAARKAKAKKSKKKAKAN